MAAEELNVLIVEDDPFARNWMTLLLARDWRTRVMADVGSPLELGEQLDREEASFLDLVILDTEMPGDHRWLQRALNEIADCPSPPAVLFTGTHPNLKLLQRGAAPSLRGYVLKNEIEFSLVWAVDLAAQGFWVTTPGILSQVEAARGRLPRPACVIDGRKSIWHLNDHQLNVARLAFLFSMERRELADEMQITDQWSYVLVSGLYKKLGIGSSPTMDFEARDLFGDNQILLGHFQRIMAGAKGKRKGQDLETLAFHLLTVPEVAELR